MAPEELRLECLRLAVAAQAPSPVTTAAEMAEFVAAKRDSKNP